MCAIIIISRVHQEFIQFTIHVKTVVLFNVETDHKYNNRIKVISHCTKWCVKQDYCNTCAKHNTDFHTKRTTLNRIQQSGNASVEDQLSIEAEIKR